MDFYVLIYIFCGVIILLGLYNKFNHIQKMKKLDNDIKHRLEYYKHPPPASFTDDEVSRLK